MVLDVFYKANLKREEKDQINFKEFYNESVYENVNIQDQYEDWVEQKKQISDPDESFVNINNFINYPWILDT